MLYVKSVKCEIILALDLANLDLASKSSQPHVFPKNGVLKNLQYSIPGKPWWKNISFLLIIHVVINKRQDFGISTF